jgi:hypothetical protein
MKPRIALRECLSDPQLLGHVMVGDTWKPQRILSIAAMGETLTEDDSPDVTMSPATPSVNSTPSAAAAPARRSPRR